MIGTDKEAVNREIQEIVADQREYAELGPVGRWRWRRAHWGPPDGWRAMTLRAHRRRRKEARSGNAR